MTENIYQFNDIMRVIGHQNSCSFIDDDFMAVLEAHKAAGESSNDLFSVALDFFYIGIICGRRRERADRNRRQYMPLKKELERKRIAAELAHKPALCEVMAIYELVQQLDPQTAKSLLDYIDYVRGQQSQEV